MGMCSPCSDTNQHTINNLKNALLQLRYFQGNQPAVLFNQHTPTSLHTQHTPTSLHNQHTPTSLHNQHTPTSLRTQYTPTSLRTQHTPTSLRTQHTPTSLCTQHTPTSLRTPHQPHCTLNTPTSLRTHHTPTSLPTQHTLIAHSTHTNLTAHSTHPHCTLNTHQPHCTLNTHQPHCTSNLLTTTMLGPICWRFVPSKNTQCGCLQQRIGCNLCTVQEIGLQGERGAGRDGWDITTALKLVLRRHEDNHVILTIYSPLVTICTAQWSLYVPHSGHYMYRTVQHSTILRVRSAHTVYVFCVDLRTNSDYFPTQH